MKLAAILLLLLAPCVTAAEIKVAVLHPLLADLAREVGGEHVEVVDLIGPGGDPHKFEPSAKELQSAKGADLYLASGKGLESYLGKLKGIVGAERVVEVGASLPTLQAVTLCEHGHDHAAEGAGEGDGHEHHDHGEVDDPHWWQSLDCWGRAARVVSKNFAALDPAHAAEYRANAAKQRKKFEKLHRWVQQELAKVPAEQRVLATSHAAFAYFCHDYEWRMLPVQGLNREQAASPKFVGEVARIIVEEKVAAVFPEQRSNPKMLQALAKQVGVQIGKPLIADGGGSIEEMFRHNVNAIVAALGVNEAVAP